MVKWYHISLSRINREINTLYDRHIQIPQCSKQNAESLRIKHWPQGPEPSFTRKGRGARYLDSVPTSFVWFCRPGGSATKYLGPLAQKIRGVNCEWRVRSDLPT